MMEPLDPKVYDILVDDPSSTVSYYFLLNPVNPTDSKDERSN